MEPPPLPRSPYQATPATQPLSPWLRLPVILVVAAFVVLARLRLGLIDASPEQSEGFRAGYMIGNATFLVLAGWLVSRFVKGGLGLVLAVLLILAWGAVASLPKLLPRLRQQAFDVPSRPPQNPAEAKERLERIQRASKDMNPRMQQMVEISTRVVGGLTDRATECQRQVTELVTPDFNDDGKLGSAGVLEQRLETALAFWRQAKETADYRALLLPRMREEFVQAGISLVEREPADFLMGVEKGARPYERTQYRFFDAQIGLANALLWRLNFLRDHRGEWEVSGKAVTFKEPAAAGEWRRREDALQAAATHFDQTNEELEAARRGDPLRR